MTQTNRAWRFTAIETAEQLEDIISSYAEAGIAHVGETLADMASYALCKAFPFSTLTATGPVASYRDSIKAAETAARLASRKFARNRSISDLSASPLFGGAKQQSLLGLDDNGGVA